MAGPLFPLALASMALRNRLRPPIAILDERSSFAYVPIPKNATSSIKHALLAHLRVELPGGARHVHERSIPWKTRPLDEVLDASGIYRFAFVRNPWERLFSTWQDKVRSSASRNWLRPLAGVPRTIGFPEFVEWVTCRAAESLEEHLRPQSEFLLRGGECRVDFVGHVETIQQDWETLRRRFDFPPVTHRNQAERRFPDLDAATINRIGDYYRIDVEAFGYPEP